MNSRVKDHLESWKSEMQSAYLYDEMSKIEPLDSKRRWLFDKLASCARQQAITWARLISEETPDTKEPLTFVPDFRTRLVKHLIHFFGPRAIKPVLSAMKLRGLATYYQLEKSATHEAPSAHSKEKAHRLTNRGGNNLRAAVFGANDGLLSNASLILGVSGASQDPAVILLSGVAGLLAGAFSMGAGEYISVKSQRELFEYQIELEKKELEEYPEEEAEELALIYQAKGISPEEAKKIADALISNPEQALDTLAREELGISPTELGSPWGAALFSFFSFSAGALVPLFPFFWMTGQRGLLLSIALTATALFLIGATLSLFTGQNAIRGGIRMLLIGTFTGLATYCIGRIFGMKNL
ncbi:MAG: hypothetical protein JWQ35_1194 [Bacteriovoracaceae bacterium]|nr:hypothetical protein [Bacteriovoracaceae bacterium]